MVDVSGHPHPRAIVIVAAGSGTRLGLRRPKAFVDVGDRTILEHALDAVFQMAAPAQVIVVVPADLLVEATALCAAAAGAAAASLVVVVGGATRQSSVGAGLSALDPAVRTVLVHDAARAFTPVSLFEAVAQAVEGSGSGVVPGLAVTDTIKQRGADGLIAATLDRSTLVAVQTPQGFPRDLLVEAYGAATVEHTDDAALYAAAGLPVSVVEGDAAAFKITTPWDLRRAESLAASRRPALDEPDARASGVPSALDLRTGVGTDVHAFDAAAPLWLGGLLWPGEPGLAGHSDGDALSHAICDALLSAAGLGDVGSRFGTTDARYAGAHGDVFLTETVRLVTEAGFRVLNVAVQVVARRPRLSPRRAELEQHLGALVGSPVSVAGTTSDGLGFTGTGEGIAVIATALVYRGA